MSRRWQVGFAAGVALAPLLVFTGLRLARPRADSSRHVPSPVASPSASASGACRSVDGRCAAGSAKDCEASDECRVEGQCTLKDGRCVVGGADDCARSERCKRDGVCRLIENELGARCGVFTHADCAQTEACRDRGRCRVAPLDFGGDGRCLAVTLVERERFPLTAARHGIDGELVLAVDPEIAESEDADGRGYWPNEVEPRVAAALQLRDGAGIVRDEMTLFPDVFVRKEDLGAGTDTFLATERLACLAGHWCGWTTRFYEVREGRLALLKAVNSSGEEREVVVVSSGGSRWKLEAGSRPSPRELVAQVEGPVPPGPALTETRFRFFATGTRFTEKKWDDYQPWVRKQAGRWSGALEFHGFP